jgi:colicin import membrane protein
MKTKFLKYSICISILFIASNTLIAQDDTKKVKTTSYISEKNEPGKTKETISSVIDDTEYKMIMINEKTTAFYVDGKLIPADQYSQYEAVIVKIKEQWRLDKIQAKNDQVMALKDQQQAKQDQKQAQHDQQLALRNDKKAKIMQEKSMQDQHNAKISAERAFQNEMQAKLNAEQAGKNQINAKLDAEKAEKDEQQSKIEAEQANRDQAQAKLDQEQAMKEQALAKLDQKQAEEDQRLVKQLINDLIKDGIVADEKSILSVTLSATEMTVNDKKQPDAVFAKYKARYIRFSTGHFSLTNLPDGSKNIRMNKP